MKTFRDITIGSEIYFIRPESSLLVKTDSYGHTVISENLIRSVVVKDISIDQDGDIRINKSENRYSGSNSYDFKLNISVIHKRALRNDKKEVVFVERKLADVLARKVVLQRIKEEEKRIPDTKASVEKNIKEIREKYFEILNPTHYPQPCQS